MMSFLMNLSPVYFPHEGTTFGQYYEVQNVQYSPIENKTYGVFNRYDIYDTEGTSGSQRIKHLQIRWIDGKVTPEVFMRDGGEPTESHVVRTVAK